MKSKYTLHGERIWITMLFLTTLVPSCPRAQSYTYTFHFVGSITFVILMRWIAAMAYRLRHGLSVRQSFLIALLFLTILWFLGILFMAVVIIVLKKMLEFFLTPFLKILYSIDIHISALIKNL